jgi:hypothetical protein
VGENEQMADEHKRLDQIVEGTLLNAWTSGWLTTKVHYQYLCGSCKSLQEPVVGYYQNNPLFSCTDCRTTNQLKATWRSGEDYDDTHD